MKEQNCTHDITLDGRQLQHFLSLVVICDPKATLERSIHQKWRRSTRSRNNHINRRQGDPSRMTTATRTWAWATSLISITITMINTLNSTSIQITTISPITHILLLFMALVFPPLTPTTCPPSNPLPPMTPPSPPTVQCSRTHLKCKRKAMLDVNGDGQIYFHYILLISSVFVFVIMYYMCAS